MQVREVQREFLPFVIGEDWVDTARRPYVEGSRAFVPVKPGFPVDGILPSRRPYRGRGFRMIGDIAVIHGSRPTRPEVEEIQSWRNPRGIVWIRCCEGAMRIPDGEVINGSSGETCHREQGITYYLDPLRVMFAQGNREEKVRMQRMTVPGERVADMFAGIGYFSIPIAMRGASVHAMEINPVACTYLERNTRANGVETRVSVSCGDCRTLLTGLYDRVVMGHFEAPGFLSVALSHVQPGSRLHVHSTGTAPPEIRSTINDAGFRAAIQPRKVKKYRPGAWHWVQDVTCR
jgi:tRNA wybutosine-synthesizing protein 2